MAVWLLAILTLTPMAKARHLAQWLARDGQSALSASGGRPWGLWEGHDGEGFGADEVILMSTWPDDGSAGAAVELMKAMPEVIGVIGTPLHPTLRPRHAQPVTGAGVWVFRDVQLPMAEVENFLRRSAAAWESFEAACDREVIGLFRCPNVDAETASLLLLTRHADSATGEAAQHDHLDSTALVRFAGQGPFPLWTRARGAALQALPTRS
jgi:hypothetical protein